MSRIRRTTHHRWLGTGAVLAVLMLGCGDTLAGDTSFEDSGGMGGANAPDGFAGESGAGGAGGAAVPSADGGVSGFESNPVEMLLANPERNPFDFLGTDTQGGSDYAAAAALCYSVDEACAGPDCSAFASCCLDSGQCCGPKHRRRLSAGAARFRELPRANARGSASRARALARAPLARSSPSSLRVDWCRTGRRAQRAAA